MIADSFGRSVAYLRLSVTQACSMRCLYCRPAGLMSAGRAVDEGDLTRAEIRRLVEHLVQAHGLRKVRLTGGEPCVRPDIEGILADLHGLKGLQSLALTTNGLTLRARAQAYRDAGLQRVNVSLDSLDPEGFARITGCDGLHLVLDGIDAALAAGLTPVKINTVVVRGENDDQLARLVAFAAVRGLEIRFIELMPMGPLAEEWGRRFVPASEMRWRLSETVARWTEVAQQADAARGYVAHLHGGGSVRVGFITAMSCPFCAACDRLRIASDGTFFPCLMDRPAGTLRDAIRPVFCAQEIDRRLGLGYSRRAREHPARGVATMISIGG